MGPVLPKCQERTLRWYELVYPGVVRDCPSATEPPGLMSKSGDVVRMGCRSLHLEGEGRGRDSSRLSGGMGSASGCRSSVLFTKAS